MRMKRGFALIFPLVFCALTPKVLAVDARKATLTKATEPKGLYRRAFQLVVGAITLNSLEGMAQNHRKLGLIKKDRSLPFAPTPLSQCSDDLGEKKKLAYYIEATVGCTQPDDRKYLFGPTVESFIADLVAKWDFVVTFYQVKNQNDADFTVSIGDGENPEFCTVDNSWSMSRKKLLLGSVKSGGLTHNRDRVRGIVLHEFGHVLGLDHEHVHPDFPYALKLDELPKLGIPERHFDEFETIDPKNYLIIAYNPDSVMQYYIPRELTMENVELKMNFKLSEGDYIAGLVAIPPCGLTSEEAHEVYLNLREETDMTGEALTAELFCQRLLSELGLNTDSERCKYSDDDYFQIKQWMVVGSIGGSVLLVICCGKCFCCNSDG